jgi:hypothetical protein
MKRWIAVLVAFNVIWLLSTTGVVVVALILSAKSSDGVHTLLTNGKTSSALSAKKTAREVALQQQQQRFDHAQTQNGQTEIKDVVKSVEKHLDATIHSSISQQAAEFHRELGH